MPMWATLLFAALNKQHPVALLKKATLLEQWLSDQKGVRRPTVLISGSTKMLLLSLKKIRAQGDPYFGPVARELREKEFMKIISLAPEVL